MAQDSGSASRFQRLIKAMEYKRLSRQAYDIVMVNLFIIQVYQGHPNFFQGASRRAIHDNLLRQMSGALDETCNSCFFALQITTHSHF